jgi:hypothetical protein
MSIPNGNEPLINAFFSQTCINRRNAQLTNVPPPRYDNLLTSPYLTKNGEYTSSQLDMRRKAEILTYNSNRMSKVNSLTKSQKFSILSRHSTSTIPVHQTQCFTYEDGELIKTPSSSCDVPGPEIMLFNDQTVPLYKFTLGNNTKGVSAKDEQFF